MNIGIIGAGNMGLFHGNLINQSGQHKLSGIFDVDCEKGQEAARRFQTKFYSDINVLLDTVEMVFITIPNTLHADTAVHALQKGKHVFVEKPMATNLPDADRVLEAATKSGKRLFVGFNRRFAPVYREAKRCISTKEFIPTTINIIQNDGDMKNPAWLSDESLTGGFLYETTIHTLDMAEFLMGDISEIRAFGKAAFYSIMDNVTILISFKSGTLGVISSCGHASWIEPFERVQIVGDHRSVITRELDSIAYSSGLDTIVQGYDYSELQKENKWGYKQMHEHIFQCLSEKIPSQVDIDAGYKSCKIIDACYKCISNNKSLINI